MMTFFLSQKNTEEQNTQHSTETLSQPISQNLTATFSSNALWTLYAGGLLWDRNSGPKGSVKSVSSVREKYVLCERKICTLWEKDLFYVKKKGYSNKLKMSGYFAIHIPLFSRTRSSWTKKTPFNIREHAFQGTRTCPSWCKKGMFLNAVYNVLISWRL